MNKDNSYSLHLIIVKTTEFIKKFQGKSYLGIPYEQLALSTFHFTSYDIVEFDNLIEALDNNFSDFKFVCYADKPFIVADDVVSAINTIMDKDIYLLKTDNGFVVRNGCDSLELKKVLNGNFSFIPAQTLTLNLSLLKNLQLVEIQRIVRFSIIDKHISNGVEFADMENVYIDQSVSIGKGTIVKSGNHLRGNTVVGENVILEINNLIENSTICDNASVLSSVIKNSKIGKKTTVGPFAFLRDNAIVGNECRVGDYVEIKKSIIGDGTKISHLTYVGDATVGVKCNIGCGVVFANYDGEHKYNTVIGNNVFIGSNCNLVAPRVIKDNVYIAAGTTVTQDLIEGDFCIGRSRETIKKDRVSKYKRD